MNAIPDDVPVFHRPDEGRPYLELDTGDPAGAERRPLHPSVAHLLRFFAWEHLPPHLAAVSRPMGELALRLAWGLPGNPEATVALRKLLEAKDCAVRALLP